jgi:two-component system LytT family response regulator
MKIRTVIVDDEPPARRRILSLLGHDPSFELVGECPDGDSAIKLIVESKPALVFLDVQMPGVDGFSVLEAVAPVHLPAVIFVTAYDQYAIKAFDCDAIDYLLKPFSRARFRACLERAKSRIASGGDRIEQEKLLGLLRRTVTDRGRLVIRSKGKLVFVQTQEIEWVEAAGNYVQIHAGGRTHATRETISAFEALLPPDRFLRIHRSIIVNIDAIAEVQSCGAGEYVLVLRGGKELPVGRSYRENLDSVRSVP